MPLGQVHALAERALTAGSASGQGLGVLCIHFDGYEERCRRDGESIAVAAFIKRLERMPFESHQILCGHRDGAKAIFYVQGLDGDGMRCLGQQCCDAGGSGKKGTGLSVGAAHSLGQRHGNIALENVRLAAVRGARLALRTGGGRFAYIERFGPAMVANLALQTEPIEPAKPARPPAPKPPEESTWILRPKEPPQIKSTPVDPQPVVGDQDLFEERMRSSELAWQRRVDRLERRLEKMGRLLEGAEQRSDEPAQWVDGGVASRFQSVQGLDQRDDQFEAKAGLMSALFQANKEMRDNLNGRTAG